MKCPLSDRACRREICIWWNQKNNECCIASVIRYLDLIDDDIAHMRNSLWELEKRVGKVE
jgi:hypothetical protein